MKNKIIRIFIALALFFLLSAFLGEYLSLHLWDYDFWWHIATGRYIINSGEIPIRDPFSYTSALEENTNLIPERESFILSQYWLSQIAFFIIYKTFGDSGIIILRALIFLSIVLLILWQLAKNGVSFYLCFFSAFIAGLTVLSFTAERPVLFTIFFSLAVFLILEKFRTERKRSLFLLPPLMLLWANMHGGFILGNAIILAFMLGEFLSIALKQSVYTKSEIVQFYSICTVSIIISSINPNGFNALLLSISPKHKIFFQGIEEYVPTFSLYHDKLRSLDIGYISLVVLLFPVLILRNRKMSISHIIVLLGLFGMSLYAFRFVIYFVVIGIVILMSELHVTIESLLTAGKIQEYQERLKSVFAVATLISSLIFFINTFQVNRFSFKQAVQTSVPKNAIDFIETNRLSGNLYNDFVFGGYVTWRLHPWKRTFIDTRALNYTVLQEARWINSAQISLQQTQAPAPMFPLWERLLNHYNVDIVFLDTLDVHGAITPLVLTLLENDRWVPVYADPISIVFLKNGVHNEEVIRKYRIQKNDVFIKIIERAAKGTIIHNRNPNYFISLGDIFYKMGRKADALAAYDYAILRLPENDPTRIRLQKIRSAI